MESQNALYMNVCREIMQAIQNGEYGENAPLPSERALCEKYHVSRSTIRQALDVLKKSDLVYSVQGNGTFIKPQVFTQPLTGFYSFTDTLKRSNILIKNDILFHELIPAEESLEKKTGFPAGSLFHELVRLRSARDYPLMLETTYLPQNRFLRLDLEVLSKGSLYEYLKLTYNFHVDQATETFRPVIPTADESALLQVSPGTPCILLERFSYEHGILIEYTKSIVRGDKYIFRVEWRNQPE